MEFEAQMLRYDCLLFDLDDTLYALSSGIAAECTNNIKNYAIQKLGVEESKIDVLGRLLYTNYGTTMAGLRAIGYDFDYDDYHRFVHGNLPYERLKPDPVLRNLLLSLPIRKLIFTNADMVHAAEVLGRLGLEDCFEGIICFETLNPGSPKPDVVSVGGGEIFDIAGAAGADAELPKSPVLCKPSEDAFEYTLKVANLDPKRTMFFDDSARNVESAKCIGLHTVIVGTSQRKKGADHAVESIHNIREALPELWEGAEKTHDEVVLGSCQQAKVAIETIA